MELSAVAICSIEVEMVTFLGCSGRRFVTAIGHDRLDEFRWLRLFHGLQLSESLRTVFYSI